MKNKIAILFILAFLSIAVKGQTIAFSTPNTTVSSGTIVTLVATGETANKYIGSVPTNGDASYYVGSPGIGCALYDTDYYIDNQQSGKFKYTLTNTTSQDKTVKIAFSVLIVNKSASGNYTYNNQIIDFTITVKAAPLMPQYAINIISVPKVETILFGIDCGFPHSYSTSYNSNGLMEYNVWKFAYNINFTKNNTSINDTDIYWEWIVEDPSAYFYQQKQFLVYPYGTSKQTPLNGEQHVLIEANDRLDEYSSRVIVRAKSRTTGMAYSADYFLSVAAVDH